MGEHPLKHHEEFKQALAHYSVSDRAKNALKDLKLVLLLSPTSGGKNTIIQHLIKTGHYHFLVSDTTRPPRINDGILEQDGIEYWFKTEEEVLDGIKAGEYLEAELIHGQQVSGISIAELERAKGQHKVAITDVDIEGVHNIVRVKPDAVCVLLLPPSFEQWQQRLSRRGQMTGIETARRLDTANKIFEDGVKQPYYKFVISENINQSAKIIDALVEGGQNPHQGRGNVLLHHLMDGLQSVK